MKPIATLAVALFALSACNGSTDSDPGSGEDTFDANSLSSYSKYSDAGYTWAVDGGSLTATGPATHAVLTRVTVETADGWVEAVSRRADDGGLVLRFKDQSHYYFLAFRDDAAPSPRPTQNLAVYHHVGLEYHQLWVKNVDWVRGTPHTIRFEAAGANLRVYFDGVQQVELTPSPLINDPAPYTGSGHLGLRYFGLEASWITVFDTFRWHSGG
jgi:hypothetical protein